MVDCLILLISITLLVSAALIPIVCMVYKPIFRVLFLSGQINGVMGIGCAIIATIIILLLVQFATGKNKFEEYFV